MIHYAYDSHTNNSRIKDCNNHKNYGFTLIEVSIVLVIIAILIGIVSVSVSLLRNTQITTVISAAQAHLIAVQNFKKQYKSLPGDSPRAFDFFGASCGTNADVNISSAGCNGDGNNQVDFLDLGATTSSEHLKVWQHLALGRFINGTFSGTRGSATDHYTSTTPNQINNSPLLSTTISGVNGVWWMIYTNNGLITTGIDYAPTTAGNYLRLAADQTIAAKDTANAHRVGFLSPGEIYSIDKKTDDGIALTGQVQGWDADTPANSCLDAGSYDLDVETAVCQGIWLVQ